MAVYPIRPTSGIQTTIRHGGFSREAGDPVTTPIVSTVGLQALQQIDSYDLLPIAENALEPVMEEAKAEWPVWTGASRDSFAIRSGAEHERRVRAYISVGGPDLIADERNTKHIDYAPFIEYNGSPTGKGQDALFNAFANNQDAIKQAIRDGVAQVVAERLGRL